MSTALTKAIRRADSIADAAFQSSLNFKQAGGTIDLTPSGSMSVVASWQEQSIHEARYDLLRGWVYSAINVLASEAAGQPPLVMRLSGSTAKQEGKNVRRQKNLHLLSKMTKSLRTKAATIEFEVLDEHPVLDLMNRPNPIQQKWQFVYAFVSNLCLTGWSYVVLSMYKGKLEMYCLPTTWVKPVHNPHPFAKFEVKNPDAPGVEPKVLDRRQVGFAHLPNPSDPMSAYAPASAQMMAIRIDDHIQTSQEAFFRNGIFPSVVLTVGKMPFMDSEGRPVLTGAQRRQIFGAVKKVWGGTYNQGQPAIVDGLIEKIERLSATQNEMGWQRSEDKVRTRILSAFAVHPYLLGEPVGVGGYAQVANIEKRFYKRVNTYLDMLGTLLTNLLGSIEGDERLVIGYEECQVQDPQLRQALLLAMRTSGDIGQNEMRAEAGFAPDEDLNPAVISASMMTGIQAVLTLLGSGQIQREQAVATFEGMGIPTDMAEEIAGVGLPEPEPPPPPAPPEPPKPPASEGGEEEETEEEPEEGEIEEAVEELKRATRKLELASNPKRWTDEILESVET